MNMKKITSLIMLVILALLLAACGGSAKDSRESEESESPKAEKAISKAFNAETQDHFKEDMKLISINGKYKIETTGQKDVYKVSGDMNLHEADDGPRWSTIVKGTCKVEGEKCTITSAEWSDLTKVEE